MRRELKYPFWAKVLIGAPNDCWPWIGTLLINGYGQRKYQGKGTTAHRVAFQLHNKVTLSTKQYVCHRCDNPSCCNPEHLFVGSHADNMADRNAKGRQASGIRTRPETRAKGEQHGNAKLTNQVAREVRRRYLAEDVTYSSLAAEYGVGGATISRIARGLSYTTA